MTGLINTLRAAGILVVGGIAAALLFAVLGSLLVAAGVFVSVLVVAGGLHYLVFGRKAVVETRVNDCQSVIYRNNAADFAMTRADVEGVNYPGFAA
ncbi:MAG: hypothetical protein B7Z15_16115, partial [Rhizobiales bacterium 32-66-8]